MTLTSQKVIKAALMLMILLLCAGIIALILFGIQQFKISSQLAGVNQVANLSHLLVRQQANLFSMLLVNGEAKTELLTENLDNFSKEDFVIDAAVYGSNGELLARGNNAVNLRYQLGLEASNLQTDNSQQIVETIYSPTGVVGFLRVTFDTRYGQTSQNKIDHLFHQLYGEVLLVFLVGILLASSADYFLSHSRRLRRAHLAAESPAENKAPKRSPSLSFHRKRRRSGK